MPLEADAAIQRQLEEAQAESEEAQRKVQHLQAENDRLRAHAKEVEAELSLSRSRVTRLQALYSRTLEQLQLARRRMFLATSQRTGVLESQLEFEALWKQAKALEAELKTTPGGAEALTKAQDESGTPDGEAGTNAPPSNSEPEKDKRKNRTTPPTGRRDVRAIEMPEVIVPITDPELEGVYPVIGYEDNVRVGRIKGGPRRIILRRSKYKMPGEAESQPAPTVVDASETTTASDNPQEPAKQVDPVVKIVTTPLPEELLGRGLFAPDYVAFFLIQKYMMGVPFYRLEQQLTHEGFPVSRAVMCRYAEDAGATLGDIVEAMRAEAIATAFCLSTDATGVAVQPVPLADGKPQPCRKGHFFVTLADLDHIFFDYQVKHDSAVVWIMFKGFMGYVQADAHAIYNALFKGIPPPGTEPMNTPPPTEVACWSHARAKFWEAAVCKHPVGLVGLRLIDAIFASDRSLSALPPATRKVQRDILVRPKVDAFFQWAHDEERTLTPLGLVRTAVGYAIRQETALRRFLDDGRLKLDNNASERQLRHIAIGRKNWLFFGSDDHAHAAANLFSLIASCKLHRVDPETYLAEVIHVMAYWPKNRYLELAPKYWAATRARIPAHELAVPIGPVTVPPPPEQQQTSP